jgi:choline dehydrogenase-like flavoprotein
MQTVDFPIRRYSENKEVDYLIVGIGAAGGVLLQRLARAGFEVVGMEAGPLGSAIRKVPVCYGRDEVRIGDCRSKFGGNSVT